MTMFRIIGQLFEKLISKDWTHIMENWIWIYRYIKRYWIQILIYTVLGLTGTVIGLLSSVVTRNLIDAVTGYNKESIATVASLYVGMGVGRIFLSLLTGRISLIIQTKINNEISADIFEQVLYTDWESMSKFSTGDLIARTSNDTSVISGSVLSFLPNLVNSLTSFIGAFYIVCKHDPIMAALALAGSPVLFLTSRYRIARMQGFQKENNQMYSRKINFFQETFHNIQLVKSLNLLPRFHSDMKQLQKDAYDLSVRQYNYNAWTSVLTQLLGMVVSYSCYGFAVYRLWEGSISYGTMTLFVSMAGNLTGSFQSLVHMIPETIRVSTSVDRVHEIIGLPRENHTASEEAGQLLACGMQTGITIQGENLSFAYAKGRRVFERSCFVARPGEIVALIGHSGQGKTTALRLMLGLLNPTGGSITVTGGEQTMAVSPSTRNLFSYVPQGNTMFSGTIAENLRMMRPEATDEEIIQALKDSCAWEFVSELPDGIYAPVGSRETGFSEGQGQRLSIARALVANRPVLLLDEATSALDVKTEKRVLQSIIKSAPNRTVIVSAHRPSVFALCNRIYCVENESIVSMNEQELQQYLGATPVEEK